MNLVCDIGNTHIALGFFKKKRLIFKTKLETRKAAQFETFLKNIFSSQNITSACIRASIICSVVPRLNERIKNTLAVLTARPVYLLGKDLIVPIKNLYSKPGQVGQDRLICAYMASLLYGAPLICVDLGTAITFDIVSKDMEYIGGIILPGLALSLLALHQNTALLPAIKSAYPETIIGKDTRQSMLSGITFGFGSLIDGLADKLKKKLGAKTKVIACGGDALFIKPYCKKIDYFDAGLILKGLAKLLNDKLQIASY
jgi:type III pantothenate kinase